MEVKRLELMHYLGKAKDYSICSMDGVLDEDNEQQ